MSISSVQQVTVSQTAFLIQLWFKLTPPWKVFSSSRAVWWKELLPKDQCHNLFRLCKQKKLVWRLLPTSHGCLISISGILRDLWTEGATEVENIIIIMPAPTSAGIQGRAFPADGEIASTAGFGYNFPHHRLSLLEQLPFLMPEEQTRSCRTGLHPAGQYCWHIQTSQHSNHGKLNHPRGFLIKKSFTWMAILSPACHSQPSSEFRSLKGKKPKN